MMARTILTPMRRLALLAVLSFLWSASSARAGGISGIVAFGDSLSDVGNIYLATGGVNPNPGSLYPGGSYPGGSYDPGRFSNGPIWLEYLAKDLGVAAPGPSVAGGMDYAWGGAETGTGLSPIYNTPNIGMQITQYLSTSPSIAATQLFTIWGGANDFLHGGVTDPSVPVANLVSDITLLAAAGARQFLVPNLPLLGELPATSGLPVSGALNYLSLQFDSMLHSQLDGLQQELGVTIHQVDVNSVFQNLMMDPGAHGLTNVTDPAYLDPNYNGQGYLFWDTVHPTTEIGQVIGQAAYAAVPEPPAFTLTLIAAPIVLAWRLRRMLTSPGPRPRDDSGQG